MRGRLWGAALVVLAGPSALLAVDEDVPGAVYEAEHLGDVGHVARPGAV
ncbi:hypothetical protein [Streptomyces sp. NPDC059468]